MSGGGLVLLGTSSSSTYIVYNALAKQFDLSCAIIEEKSSSRALLVRRLKKLGVRTVAGQLAFKLLAEPALQRLSRARIKEIIRSEGLDPSPIPDDRLRRVPSVNSREAIQLLQSLTPKVVVVGGTRLIAREVLDCTPAVFINVHAGITPMYRGVHGGYWALVAKDPGRCGVTVHLVDSGIDTGGVIAQQTISPTGEDSYATYPLLQLAAGLPHLLRAVERGVSGNLGTLQVPTDPSRLYSHPTIGQYVANFVRLGVR